MGPPAGRGRGQQPWRGGRGRAQSTSVRGSAPARRWQPQAYDVQQQPGRALEVQTSQPADDTPRVSHVQPTPGRGRPEQQAPAALPGPWSQPPARGRGSAWRGRGAGRGMKSPQIDSDRGRGKPAPAEAVKQPVEEPDLALEVLKRKNLREGGKCGKAFSVYTNHLALKIDPNFKVAMHYDVAITPDRPKRMMRPVWEAFRREHLSNYKFAFDDVKNAYSPSRLPDDISANVTVVGDDESRPMTYHVQLRFAAEVDLRALFSYMDSGCRTAVPQDALQCIDIVFRNAAAQRSFVRVARSYFSKPHGIPASLGDGLELWRGFFQSAVIGWKPFLNVDVAHKGFIKPQPVSELIMEIARDPNQLQYRDIEKISKVIQGVKVQYQIPQQPATKRVYRTNSLVQLPAEAMFEMNGKRISVLQYFKQHKGYDIKLRHLPCLHVGPRDRKDPIYLPPELCTILDKQVFYQKLNEIQTRNMIKFANTSTQVRKQNIMDSVKKVDLNNDPVVQGFGLSVGTEFEKIPVRLLSPPTLEYNNRILVQPAKGEWRAAKFLEAQHLPPNSWTIINVDGRVRNNSLEGFATTLQRMGHQVGMNIGNPAAPFQHMQRFNKYQFKNMLQKYKNKKLLFIVVPPNSTDIYSNVKQVAELEVGCLTQCITSKSLCDERKLTNIVGNILLKVNAKLNGHNHIITDASLPLCLREPCMIIGADVTHPPPGQNDIPSVAAVTASCDPRTFRYNFSWRLQPPGREFIDDLENIVYEQFLFFKKSGQLPHRIIFFRDGVAESQFKKVMNIEVLAIRRACAKISSSYEPPITFLVVQKRHHTRFFPTSSAESEDRNCNVRAGTVVDTHITHPTAQQYYLVSHASIQGVARPTKYSVLWDDSDMPDDEVQALTYYMCHMFSRCTRSVSYPAPTYYAHLAAFRARHYLEGQRVDLNNLKNEQARRAIHEDIVSEQPMFFV